MDPIVILLFSYKNVQFVVYTRHNIIPTIKCVFAFRVSVFIAKSYTFVLKHGFYTISRLIKMFYISDIRKTR